MASEVEIVNFGLALLGQPAITSLTDGSKASTFANLRFASLRDAVLRAHPWNFAIKRRILAKLAEIPAFGFSNYFALPSDFLRLHIFNPTTGSGEWSIEQSESSGRALATDDDAANLIYIARVTDTGQFDALFIEVLAARIAWDLAMPIVNSSDAVQLMQALYESKLGEARSVDAQEGPPKVLEANGFLDARLASGDLLLQRNIDTS